MTIAKRYYFKCLVNGQITNYNANIIIKSMYSLKWNIFLNKVIAPGFARSNNFYNENSLFTL